MLLRPGRMPELVLPESKDPPEPQSQRTVLEVPWFLRIAGAAPAPPPRQQQRPLPAAGLELRSRTRWTLFLSALLVTLSFSMAVSFTLKLQRDVVTASSAGDGGDDSEPTPPR